VRTWLLDTGPVVAYLDASEPAHDDVASRLDGFTGRLVTTGAVITEVTHFVSASREGAHLAAKLVASARVEIYDLCQPPELLESARLMEKYADTPMDFADATLVLLSEAFDVRDILTLDRRGFSTYRTRRRRAFRLVLDE